MDCSLWLNRKKINSAAQIPDNLDVASLRGYFLAGSLIEWLEEHGGEKYAAQLSKLSRDDSALNEKIAAVFGGKPIPVKQLSGAALHKNGITKAQNTPCSAGGSFRILKMPNSFKFSNSSFGAASGSYSGSYLGSYSGLLEFGSFLAYLSGKFGSFGISSFFGGSFSEWEWEWLWEYFREYSGGSFVSNSFSVTSFSQLERLRQLFKSYFSGLFVSASFSAGSFLRTSFSQWEQFFEMFGSFSGDWSSFSEKIPLEMDEYDFIMFKTLMICPLDRFGYGIHII